MKNLFLRTIAIGLFLLAMPSIHYGQGTRSTKIFELNVSGFNTIEERTFMIHSIQDHGYFCLRNDNKPNTIDIYLTVGSSLESEDFDAYMENLYEECVNFSQMDKSERGELFIQWRQELDDEVFYTIYESFTKGIATENASCETAAPFCTDNGAYIFTAGVNSGSPCGNSTSANCSAPYSCSSSAGQTGGCLYTAPNPAFYYLKIASTGNLNIKIYSSPRYDIDFDCWGPFDNMESACSQLSCSKIVDCSYAGGTNDEHCHINNAISGKYYILLLTNYSNQECTIHFENTGTGATDCSIMPPLVESGSPYCVGETLTLSGNAQSGATYSWSGPGNWHANGANVTRPNCTMAMSGTYTCTITLNGQQSSAETEVVVYPNVTSANFTTSASTACVGEAIQFAGSATTNPSGQQIQSYTWTFGDGSSGSGQNITHTYTQPGTYTAKLTASCGGHCTAEKTKTITVYNIPVANAGADQNINYGASAHLQGSGGNSGNFSYHWEPANKVNNANIANPQTIPLTETTTFTLTVANPSSTACFDTDEVTINVNGNSMTATGSASPDVICSGSSTRLSVNASNGTGQYTYSWRPATGLSNPTSANPTATPQQTTTYICTVSDGITSQSIPVTITVHAMPLANAGDDHTISYGHTALLEGSGGAGTFSYHWEPADMVLSPNAQNTTTVGLTATQTFTLTVTNPNHTECVSTAEVTISIEGSDMTINPSAAPSAICEGENTAQLNAHAGGGTGNFSYTWSPETGLDDPHSATPIASPATTTTYSCTVSDGYSTSTKNVTVTVYHPETADETHYTCANEPFVWHGQYYSAEGDYEFDTLTDNGCRKTITLHLHHYPIYDETTITEAICSGETYDFFGTPYNQTNNTHESLIFHDAHTLSSIHGCDSIVRLNLTIYPENELTVNPVEICPEQTYNFYGTPYNQPIEVDYIDHDIHGCDSIVRLVLSVGEYYIPGKETQYIAYDDQPSFTWDVNGVTYTTEGLHIDTLETDACKAIYELELHFKKVPDPIITIDTACDNYTWTVLDVDHHYSISQGSVGQQISDIVRDNMAPYHYEDGRPSYQDYLLELQMYKTSDHEGDLLIDGECDSYTWQFGHNGETETYNIDGQWTKTIKSKLSNYHCDSIATLTIQNMKYPPHPYDSIFPTESSTIMSRHYDTAYVITNTEFFSFIYDFYASEKGSSKWDGCIWEKSPWCDWDIAPYAPQGETVNKCCKVYVGQRYEDPVKLTCKMWNDCMAEGDTLVRTLYLKSSFLGVDEQPQPMADGNVVIIPNPNNGQMQFNFENMDGHVNIKVYDMTGRMIDGFETNIFSHNQNCDYRLKNAQDGIYFFIISNERQFLTRKVVLIH